MKLVYFAWLREKLGTSGETVSLPDGVHNIADLLDWQKSRDAVHADVFEHCDIIQVAINKNLVHDRSQPIANAEEIAFFPPMTGG